MNDQATPSLSDALSWDRHPPPMATEPQERLQPLRAEEHPGVSGTPNLACKPKIRRSDDRGRATVEGVGSVHMHEEDLEHAREHGDSHELLAL